MTPKKNQVQGFKTQYCLQYFLIRAQDFVKHLLKFCKSLVFITHQHFWRKKWARIAQMWRHSCVKAKENGFSTQQQMEEKYFVCLVVCLNVPGCIFFVLQNWPFEKSQNQNLDKNLEFVFVEVRDENTLLCLQDHLIFIKVQHCAWTEIN